MGDNWPLIRYLLDDPTYYDSYVKDIQATLDTAFVPDRLAQKYASLAALIRPYASEEIGEETFDAAVQQLTGYAAERVETVQAFLDEQ